MEAPPEPEPEVDVGAHAKDAAGEADNAEQGVIYPGAGFSEASSNFDWHRLCYLQAQVALYPRLLTSALEAEKATFDNRMLDNS